MIFIKIPFIHDKKFFLSFTLGLPVTVTLCMDHWRMAAPRSCLNPPRSIPTHRYFNFQLKPKLIWLSFPCFLKIKVTEQSINQSVNQSKRIKTINQINQSSQSINQSIINRSNHWSVSQSINQSNDQSINQCKVWSPLLIGGGGAM